MKNEHGLPDWLCTVIQRTRDDYNPGENTEGNI